MKINRYRGSGKRNNLNRSVVLPSKHINANASFDISYNASIAAELDNLKDRKCSNLFAKCPKLIGLNKGLQFTKFLDSKSSIAYNEMHDNGEASHKPKIKYNSKIFSPDAKFPLLNRHSRARGSMF